MKKKIILITFVSFIFNITCPAQAVFKPVVFQGIREDYSILERSLKQLEERKLKFEEDYYDSHTKFAEALAKKDTIVAIVHLDRCIRINDQMRANFYLSYFEEREKLLCTKADLLWYSNPAEAIQIYKEAIQGYINLEKYKDAISTIEKALKITNEHAFHINLAYCYWKDGWRNKAISILDEIIPIYYGKDKAYCFFYKAQISSELSQITKALEYINEAIKEYQDILFYDFRASLYYSENQFDNSINDLVQMLSLTQIQEQQDIINIRIWMAKYNIAEKSGDKEHLKNAKKILKKYTKKYPDVKSFLNEHANK